MRKGFKRIVALVLTVITVMGCTSSSTFAAEREEPSAKLKSNNTISFTGLSELKVNEGIEYEITDSNGNPATVGIECVSSNTRASGKTWKVWYTGVTINAHFYMTVSNNKVTSVYDKWILVVGGTFNSESLKRTSTYGKLTFNVEAYAGIAAGTCWLKGTVTGKENKVDVTWSM